MNWDWHAAAGGFWEEVGVGALGMDDFVVVVGQVPRLNLTSEALGFDRAEKVQKCNVFCCVNFALSQKPILKCFPKHFWCIVGNGLDSFRNETEWVTLSALLPGQGPFLRMILLSERLLFPGY
jgi:hypothetical protein